MKFGLGSMFENRAYRGFSKALRRLTPQFDHLEEIFQPVKLEGEKFDDIFVTFVDAAPAGYCRSVKNRDRFHHVEVAVPDHDSYKPADDTALLLNIAEKLRTVLEHAPVKEVTRTELLQRFSEWESAIRRESIRAVREPQA